MMACLFIAACNNSADSENIILIAQIYQDNKDINNRNTTVYDSAAGKRMAILLHMSGCPVNKVSAA